MQKDVKTMKNMIERDFVFVSRNLRFGGIAITLTAAFIAVAKPSEIIVMLTPYGGDPMMLSSILVMLGVLSTMLGYAMKR